MARQTQKEKENAHPTTNPLSSSSSSSSESATNSKSEESLDATATATATAMDKHRNKRRGIPHKRKSEQLEQYLHETRRAQKQRRRFSDITDFGNTVHRLSEFETDRSRSPHNKRRRTSDVSDIFQHEIHANYEIQGLQSIYDQPRLRALKLWPFANQRKQRITDIVQSDNIIVAITKHGLGAALHRRDLRILCYLNVSANEQIRSVFHNKLDASFIICSLFSEPAENTADDDDDGDELQQQQPEPVLKCRSVRARYLEYGMVRSRFLFETEVIKCPGFLEYDDDSHRILTYDDHARLYKLWDLADYSLVYSFARVSLPSTPAKGAEDVKMTVHGLLHSVPMESERHCNTRMIMLRSLQEDKIMAQFLIEFPEHPPQSQSPKDDQNDADDADADDDDNDDDPFDFMEYHYGYLYVKQNESTALKVFDCRDVRKAPKLLHSFEVPEAYLFLKSSNRLLYFKRAGPQLIGTYGVLDLVSGAHIDLQQDVENADHREAIMHVSGNQSKIFYFSKYTATNINGDGACDDGDDDGKKKKLGKKYGLIQINSLEDGQLFGCIKWDEQQQKEKTTVANRWCLSSKQNQARRQKIEMNPNPLRQITAICYNSVHNEIYTANQRGQIIVWA